MNYPGRARIQEYAEGAIKRLREDQISNKRQRVKERLSKGQFEEEAKSLASLMGMDEKEAMKLIGNKSMTPDEMPLQ
jgi:AmiR/NasT family two-component response regulator